MRSQKTEGIWRGVRDAAIVLALLGALLCVVSLYYFFEVGSTSPFFLADYPLGVSLIVAGAVLFVVQTLDRSLRQSLDEFPRNGERFKEAITVSVSPVSLAGSATFKVSGLVTAGSGKVAGTTVLIQVKNPSGMAVAAKEAALEGNEALGTYAESFAAGGASSWTSGKYSVVATYGTGVGETPLTAESAFQYFGSPSKESLGGPAAAGTAQRGSISQSEEMRDQARAVISEKWASTLEDWTTRQSLDELYLSLGCHLGTIEATIDRYLRVYLRTNVGVLGLPQDAVEEYRRRGYDFLAANWSSLRSEACGWHRENPGVLGQARIVGLATRLTPVLPTPWKEFPSVGAVIAVILIRAGLDDVCGTEARLPEPAAR